ncbi:excinuclease ABC subunit UvrC [Vallitalea okinawensis]|uniref:excinuclease ABC subunit UvrC n=1 Tax=Vallitalea okinawensis TaxID=2078660 RepID=UPI000CFB1EB0
MFDIQEELKKLPDKPGVYIMKDEYENIIYVGKAIKLKNRVRQYFQSSRNLMPKIKKMVQHIKEFEYIVTDSELEALILECTLIKKHRPRYNTLLKDDKSYPYIKVTVGEPFPRVMMTRSLKKDKSKYYGPYTSSGAVKETIEIIKKNWPIRTCNRSLPKDIGKDRPCLNYHIGQCHAPCDGKISAEDYREIISEVITFLDGKYDIILKELEAKMQVASENLDFEEAAKLRDKIKSINIVAQKQKMINSSMEDQDVIAFARSHDEALVQVFFIRGGKLIGREHFMLNGVDQLSRSEVMTTFIKQFYSGTPFIPRELILQEEIDETNIIQAWLSDKRGHKVHIKVPRKGDKSKLVDLAAKNALLTLEQFGERIKREEQRTKGAVKEIAGLIGYEQEIHRIEAYDISNTFGFQSVGSMVVFEDGKPKRSDYRKFKIKTVYGANDYASLEEVLTRRLSHALKEQNELKEKNLSNEYGKFSKLPDLILMDGGKGQVNIAKKVLNQFKLNIEVCGMVKDDRHRTRGLYYEGQEVPIDKHTEGFKLITRIQDEAHRFAIEYHKKIRWDRQVKSVLDDIPGIGPKRRNALITAFANIEKIKEATLEELEQIEGMNKKSAEAVYVYFR